MIVDKITNLSNYYEVPYLYKVENFLSQTDLSSLTVGKYDLGDDCYVRYFEYDTKDLPEGNLKLEAHREYLDVQLNLKGEELLYFQSLDLGEESVPYNKEKDVEFFTAPYTSSICLYEGNFTVLFPNDLHVGSFNNGATSSVKKLVFKLKI